MGNFITLPGSSTTPRPPLYADAVITKGTLLHVEPGHPTAPLGAAPATNDYLPNLAQAPARTLLANSSAEVRPQFTTLGWSGTTYGSWELTGKGALHGIIVNPIDSTSSHGLRLSLPTTIGTYLLANPTHAYFVSLWGRITRASGETNDSIRPPFSIIGDSSGPTAKYIYRLSEGLTRPNPPALMGSAGSPILDTLGAFRATLGISAFTGTPANTSAGYIGAWGNIGVLAATTKPHSWALYRYVLEDLTVSGRTRKEAEAADAAQYAAAFGAGGRYNGDTFTAPA